MTADPLQHLPGPGRGSVLVDGLDHPEGVAWDPGTGSVVAGGELGQVYRVALDHPQPLEIARAPDFVLGVAVDGRSRVVACVVGEHPSVCVVEDGEVRTLLTEVEGTPLLFPNYPAFAPDGTLYVTDSGGWHVKRGRIVRIDPDGAASVFSTDLDRFPNGCAVTPDGRWLWVAESQGPGVHRFDLVAGGPPELLVELHGHVPDGLAFTDGGGCLITNYRPDRIYHLDASGRLATVAQDPQGTLLAAPTNACFVGEQLNRVVSANLGRWHLTLLDLGLRGAPLHYPDRWAADVL